MLQILWPLKGETVVFTMFNWDLKNEHNVFTWFIRFLYVSGLFWVPSYFKHLHPVKML